MKKYINYYIQEIVINLIKRLKKTLCKKIESATDKQIIKNILLEMELNLSNSSFIEGIIEQITWCELRNLY